MQFDIHLATAQLKVHERLLSQVLTLMVASLDDLSSRHLAACASMDAPKDECRDVSAAWTYYYRCLHSAKPMLQLITSADVHPCLLQLCDELAQGQGEQVAHRVTAFQAELIELRAGISTYLRAQGTPTRAISCAMARAA